MSLGIGAGLHSGFIGEEENRWMKRVFASNQSSYSVPMIVTGWGTGWTAASDDTYTLKYDLYLDGSFSGAGGNDTASVQLRMESTTDVTTVAVPLDTVTSLEQSGTGTTGGNAIIMQFSSASSFPDAGDIFYVRDIVMEVYAADGTLKKKAEFDFETGGSTTSIDGSVTISTYSLDGAITTTFGENPL